MGIMQCLIICLTVRQMPHGQLATISIGQNVAMEKNIMSHYLSQNNRGGGYMSYKLLVQDQ